MAFTTINKSTDYFNTKLYTGNNADGNAITGVGHSPDFVWIKQRNAMSHRLYDKIRGVNSALISNETNAADQYAAYGQFESFDSNGFTVGAGTSNGDGTNENGQSIVAWNWKANGAGSANTDGSISSTVSANTTSGFSIVSYTGNGTGSSTVGHGLGVAPAYVIIKNTSSVDAWQVFPTGGTRLVLNSTAADYGNNGITKGATTITLPSGVDNAWNNNGQSYIMYCFAEKQGYSKFGNYIGNGNADGTFVYTGFSPSFVMIKMTSEAQNWGIYDNKRVGYNEVKNVLFPNLSNAENTDLAPIDLLSNGFKMRRDAAASDQNNKSGGTYIYMAFAEAPLVGTNNIPANAR